MDNDVNYAVTLRGQPPYITNNTGRLWAYVAGVLAGSREREAEAVHQEASGLVNAVVGGSDPQKRILADGRILEVGTWRESS